MQTVDKDKVVIFHYTLTNDAGEVIDSSRDGDPMPYLHGHSNIVEGLENQMQGKKPGDRFQVDVAPEQGYGEKLDLMPQKVPKDAFPPNMPLQEGMQFMGQSEQGDYFPLWIQGVGADHVMVTQEHPLAGETLHFDVEIVDVRDANTSELEHGHPHGLDGTDAHHH